MYRFIGVLLLCTIGVANSEMNCTELEVSDFDGSKAAGVWYVAARTGNPYDIDLKCLKYNITATPQEFSITVNAKNISSNAIYDYKIIAKPIENTTQMILNFYQPNLNGTEVGQIIGIDYEKHAIYYAKCEKLEHMWIFVRERNGYEEIKNTTHEILKHFTINPNILVEVDQTNC